MQVEIVTLIENSLGEHLDLQNEHGLSFLIRIDREQIIFDTGQSAKFIRNAAVLNFDLHRTNQVVLSHGHYDHSGGFRDLVNTIGNSFQLHIGPDFLKPKYAQNNGALKFLGNNFDDEYLRSKRIETCYVEQDVVEIVPGVYGVANFEKMTDFEPINPRFCFCSGTQRTIDRFEDEVVVVVDHPRGLIVLLGCSHPGVVNILKTIVKRFNKPVFAILGGTHLVEADEERLRQTFAFFRQLNPSMLGISHCSGEKAVRFLKNSESSFFINSTGTSIRVE
jgi:7,8-dihydropterin-6-yl-methyl-4-(beta-D-ribofuranosyl)aminobenzene 5'-phosphate synthase